MKKFLVVIALLICVMFVSPVSAFAAMSDKDFADLCVAGTVEQVEAAIKNGADVNMRYKEVPILALSTYNSNPAVPAILIRAGADVNARYGSNGVTALMVAVLQSSIPQTVFALLNNGADATLKDNNGYGIMDFLSQNAKLRDVDVLRQALLAASGQPTPSNADPSLPALVEYIDIQLSPEDYIGKDIRIRAGMNHASLSSDGKLLTARVDVSTSFIVYIENLPKDERRMLLEEKPGVFVTVTLEIIGTVIESRYGRAFDIIAKSVKMMDRGLGF